MALLALRLTAVGRRYAGRYEKMKGNAKEKRNCWSRGAGADSFRGELKRGIRQNRKLLNRMVRRNADVPMRGCGYKKVASTEAMVRFL